jgi:transposase
MEHYVGLDISLKLTAICIVDRTGKIEREGVVASDPETIAPFIKSHTPHVTRVGLEAGATSTWLWTELNKLGLPVICIDGRHAKAALKLQINKSDRNDAVGIARIMQCGWYKELHVKDLDSHAIVGIQSFGHSACEAKWAAQSQGCLSSKACCHSAPDVDRRQRIQVVIKGGC